MNNKTTFLIGALLILASIIASGITYPLLPEQIASHWNVAGQVNGYAPRLAGTALIPIILAAIFILLMILPIIDPLSKNIALFRPQYNLMVVAIGIYLLYIHVIMLGLNLGWSAPIGTLMVPGIGILFYVIGVLLKSAKRNWTFGIRTPWTLSNETVWDRTHALGARLFKVAGAIIVLSVFLGELAFPILMVTILAIVVWLTVYSYLEYRKIASK